MVSFIINWCLNNRFMVMLLTLVLGAAGYYCLINTPVDAIPDIGEKQVIVFVDWPGRGRR
jgi:Cu(I)/Ag(I) efflux system membrane protein CusA/SilA